MSKTKKNSLFYDKFDIVALAVIACIFSYFMLFHDVVRCGDSFQYENQYPMREPVYSLLLQFLKQAPEETYLRLLGFTQNILAIICVYFTYYLISRLYKFGVLCRIFTLIALLSPHLITPLASKTHLILTNTMMTEGISVSLYYVWFAFLLAILGDYYTKKRAERAAYIFSLLLSLVLAMTRGQMMLCMLIWLLLAIFKALKVKDVDSRHKILRILCYILIIAMLFVAKKEITKIYNHHETGYRVNTVSSNPMLLANIVYVCEEKDVEYIIDDDMRTCVAKIISTVKSEGLSFNDASGNIINRARFHESGHETINFDIIDPEMRILIKNRYGIEEDVFIKLMICEDELCKTASKQLLKGVAGKYLRNYLIIASLGFVRSNSSEKAFLPVISIIMYLLSVILIVCLIRIEGLSKNVLSMILVLITICGTVLGTSIVIQCITRYMIYNFPFFYIALLGMICSLKKLIKS